MERQTAPGSEDGMLYLARLLGAIRDTDLGGVFMEVLTGIVLGAEGQRRMSIGSVTGEDMWAVSCATTAQRTEAAEHVLQEYGFTVAQDETG